MKAKTKKVLARYWGYLLIPVLFLGWFYFEDLNPLVLGVLSSLTVLYALFRAPVPCAAITRGNEFCRHNAKGLLRGCHLKQHKWQNLKMLVQRRSWGTLRSAIFRSLAGNAAALTVIVGAISAFGSVVVPFLNKGGGGGS